jgi:hypothetical protein
MKAQFLKIAKCKTDKQFYAKYPTEAAFFKAHPEAKQHIKKAQQGADVNGNGIPDLIENYQPINNTYIGQGSVNKQFGSGIGNSNFGPQNNPNPNPNPIKSILPKAPIAGDEGAPPPIPGFTAQGRSQANMIAENEQITGETPQAFSPLVKTSFADKAAPYIGAATDVLGGIKGLSAQQDEADKMKQMRKVTDVQKIASGTRPEEIQRRYVRPEDVAIQPNQMFPTYGVGTNVLAKNGKLIRKAQDGLDAIESNDSYGLKQEEPTQVRGNSEDYASTRGYDNSMYTEVPVQETVTPTFDSKSARDNWVQKTGLPWSEAKRLGYTSGTAKDNIKLLSELNDPRFKKENLRTEAPKNKSQTRTPVQHTDTPTGKLTPIKKPLTMDEYFKGKPKYKPSKSNIGVPNEGSMATRLGERLANPLQTFAHYAKYRDLPSEGFSKNDKNAYDQAVGIMNPLYWANAVGNASDYASEGEYKKAMIEAADALPALGKLKYTKYLPYEKGLPAAREFVRRAGYLGEGAKRIGPGAAKQLTGNAAKQIAPGYVPNFTMYKSGGEIQNTYAPGYLYDDLGYEPLNDSNIKQYYKGGYIPRAQGGAGVQNFLNTYGSTIGGVGGALNNGSAEAQIGKGIGTAAGTAFFGPAGGMVGGALGGAVGGLFNTSQASIKRDKKAIQRNQDVMLGNQFGQSIQNQYSSVVRNGGNIPNYEEGGWVSHDWQPQVIASFGGLNEQEVYDYAHDGMDSLRAGGHISGEYTPISNRGMQQYAMGGEVKTTWGGHAETISHNPYMPGSGETIMFRGKSHDESDGNGHTGIGVKYGQGGHDDYTDYAEYGTQEADANVEVERGEPAAELQDANGEKNLTVYGNLKIPNQYIDLLGDPNAKGKKFKNYVNDLSKIEAKQNKIVESSTNKLNALNPQTQFDKLKLTSLQASIEGANMKLKDLADKKINAAHLQNAINDTAEENSLVADDLARGKAKINKEALQDYAEYGTTIPKAQGGSKLNKEKIITKEEQTRLLATGEYKRVPNNPNLIYKIGTNTAATNEQNKTATAMDNIPAQKYNKDTGFAGGVTKEKFEEYKKRFPDFPGWDTFDWKNPKDLTKLKTWFNTESEKRGSKSRILDDPKTKSNPQGVPIFGDQYYSANFDNNKKETPGDNASDYLQVEEEDAIYPVNAQKRNPWIDLAGQVLPFFRPTDQEGLDPQQLSGEMYALSSNQLEPVQAQSYQPDLATPYDISYQDQLNANQADYNATQRMVGYNPAAQAALNAQKYAANTGVLGEQFRANQAMKANVYDSNRQTLNDAKLKNLDIFDRQYGRQEQAKSNTKAITQAALNSISDKYAKNKLENRELGIYENMYNYRYDPSGRAINMNAPWQANVPTVYNKGSESANMREVYDRQGNFLRYEPIGETKTVTDETLDTAGRTTGIGDKKNGGKVKAKNGSIVSSYKNL